jgi:hypothetical protein
MKKIPGYRNVTVPMPLRLLSSIEEIKARHMTSRADVLRHAIVEGLKYIRAQDTPFTKASNGGKAND